MALSRSRLVAAVATIVFTVGVGLVVDQAPASACFVDDDGDCYRSVTGTVTATAGLNLRAAPWGTVLDTVPYNYSNTVDCYAQASDGSYWDWLYDTRIGRSGWVYDPYLYTGGNIYQQVDEMHEGNCGQWPLTIPSNVHATAISSGAIRVTWTDTNGGSAKYVVSNGNVSSADLAAGTTSYTWGGLAPNTYMCFTVAAKANGGQSPWTAYACTTTWTLKSPTNVSATPIGTGSVRVTWSDPNGGAANYVVNNGNVSSADLPAGATSYTWSGLAPNTYMCFTVAAKQSGQQSAWTAYACTTTLVYLNMGDSFSSGEGTGGPWDSGTNQSSGSPQNMCHRSSNSYSGQFASQSGVWRAVTNVACSGDTTYELTNSPDSTCTQFSPNYYPCNRMQVQAYGEQPQVSHITANTGLITITIGGNDLNLPGLVTNCYSKFDVITRNNCFLDTFNSDFITNQVDTLAANTLEPAYDAIKAKVSSVGAHPTIVVLTYPQTFPNNWSGVCVGLPAPITSPEMSNAMRNVVSAMNAQVKIAAAYAGFTVLDEEGKFLGHEECTPDPWVNDLGFLGTDNDALHPKTQGYAIMAGNLKSLLG
jgi:lysophospholipase L1-like esterase